jgi:hypothetical protein
MGVLITQNEVEAIHIRDAPNESSTFLTILKTTL